MTRAAAAGSVDAGASIPGLNSKALGEPVVVLVIGNPEAPELQALKQKVPNGAVLLGVGT
jgi:hypothetical protein